MAKFERSLFCVGILFVSTNYHFPDANWEKPILHRNFLAEAKNLNCNDCKLIRIEFQGKTTHFSDIVSRFYEKDKFINIPAFPWETPYPSEFNSFVFSLFLIFRRIHTEAELTDFVRLGLLHRHEDRTQVHEHSSRSHLIVQLNIYQYKQSALSLSVPVSSSVPASLDQGELVAKLAPTNDSRRRSRFQLFCWQFKFSVIYSDKNIV